MLKMAGWCMIKHLNINVRYFSFYSVHHYQRTHRVHWHNSANVSYCLSNALRSFGQNITCVSGVRYLVSGICGQAFAAIYGLIFTKFGT